MLLASGTVIASAEPDFDEPEQIEQDQAEYEQLEQEVLEQDIVELEQIEQEAQEQAAPDQVEPEQIESVLADPEQIEQIEPEKVKKDKKEKKKEAQEKKNTRQSKKEQARLNKQVRKQERAERRQARRDSRRHEYDMVLKMAKKKEAAKRKQTLVMRHENEKLVTRWTESHSAEVAHDYESGMYSDLYKQPAWDTPATYVPFKHLLNVGFEYKYATDAYGNSGGSGDLTRLAFGENTILLKDLLLVSKLIKEGKFEPKNGLDFNYLTDLAYKKVNFLGQAEDCIINFDLSRYLWKRNIVCGVRIPFVYQKHTISTEEPALTIDERKSDGFMQMILQYGSFENFVKDVFRAKGMNEFGGSSSGFGDVELYSHINFESSRFESMIAGAKIIIPSASKRASDKLWAPELGNGGFLGIALFSGICLHKSKYLNPHMFVQATGFADAHVNRRVPKKMTLEVNAGSELLGVTFGDRVTQKRGVELGDAEEAPFKEIGDNILSVNMRKGIEFNARMGNMIEKFVYRRAFLDVFYDLYVKAHDTFSGFKTEEWNIDPYRLCSQAVAHKIGAEYSYQYDKSSRLRAGIDYVFAGRNMSKTLGAHINMNYSF